MSQQRPASSNSTMASSRIRAASSSTPPIQIYGNFLSSSRRAGRKPDRTPCRPGRTDHASMFADVDLKAEESTHAFANPRVDIRGYHGVRPFSAGSDLYSHRLGAAEVASCIHRVYEVPVQQQRQLHAEQELLIDSQLLKLKDPMHFRQNMAALGRDPDEFNDPVGASQQEAEQLRHHRSSTMRKHHSSSSSAATRRRRNSNNSSKSSTLRIADNNDSNNNNEEAQQRPHSSLSTISDSHSHSHRRKPPLTMSPSKFAQKFYNDRTRIAQQHRTALEKKYLSEPPVVPLHPKEEGEEEPTAEKEEVERKTENKEDEKAPKTNQERAAADTTTSHATATDPHQPSPLRLRGLKMNVEDQQQNIERLYTRRPTPEKTAQTIEHKLYGAAMKQAKEDRDSGKSKFLSKSVQEAAVDRVYYKRLTVLKERQLKREEKHAWRSRAEKEGTQLKVPHEEFLKIVSRLNTPYTRK